MSQTIEPPRGGDMSAFETRVGSIASGFAYPPTPSIARGVRARLAARRPVAVLVARVALAILVALAALTAVPEVRAAVIKFFQVGAVTIFPATPTPTPGPLGSVPVTATPFGQVFEFPTPEFALTDLQGETTLERARVYVDFPVMLPEYPADLGDPDRVYLQHSGGDVVVMVWMEHDQPEKIRMSLHALGQGTHAFKTGGTIIRELEVKGAYAIWTDGPYMLVYSDGEAQMRRMIEGHVLIWTEGEVTYRLETQLSLDEALRIAESLRQ